jgi:hypothetical protein
MLQSWHGSNTNIRHGRPSQVAKVTLVWPHLLYMAKALHIMAVQDIGLTGKIDLCLHRTTKATNWTSKPPDIRGGECRSTNVSAVADRTSPPPLCCNPTVLRFASRRLKSHQSASPPAAD